MKVIKSVLQVIGVAAVAALAFVTGHSFKVTCEALEAKGSFLSVFLKDDTLTEDDRVLEPSQDALE